MSNRAPKIVIVGVQKSGTTTLYETLCQHTEIEGAKFVFPESSPYAPKELHFFSNKKRRELGWHWYIKHFSDSDCVKIEATPEYVSERDFVCALHAHLPSAKVIVMLRDPLARLISAWNHWERLPEDSSWKVPRPHASFAENVRVELNLLMEGENSSSMFERGLYYRALERLHEFYPASQVQVVYLEHLIENPAKELKLLQSWLELKPEPLTFVHANSGRAKKLDIDLKTLRDMWEIYNYANGMLEQLYSCRHPWARTWTDWSGDQLNLASFREIPSSPKVTEALKRMRRWLAIAKMGTYQYMKRTKVRFSDSAQRIRDLNAACSRGTVDSLFCCGDLSIEELLAALKAILRRGAQLTTEEAARIVQMCPDDRTAVLRIFVEHGQLEVAASCWLERRSANG